MEKAVIASDVGGLKELITEGETGLLFEHENVAALAEKIVQLADDPVLRARLGKQGREFVIANRQWRNIIDTHFRVYERARENWSKRQYLWKGLARVASELGIGLD